MNITIEIVDTNNIQMFGLDGLPGHKSKAIVEFARGQKPALIGGIGDGEVDFFDLATDLVDARRIAADDWRVLLDAMTKEEPLPNACPLATNRFTPGVERACRFNKRLLLRLVQSGALRPETGCPLVRLCGLASPWSKAPKSPATSNRSSQRFS